MSNNQYSRRLYSVAVKSGQIVPEQSLQDQAKALHPGVLAHVGSVVGSLGLLTTTADPSLAKQILDPKTYLPALAALALDCYLLAELAGTDLDSVLDAAVNQREHDRPVQPPPPPIAAGQRAPTLDELRAGASPDVVHAVSRAGSLFEA